MDWVETTGRTVEEAKKLALEQLGVDESDAEFEVVAEPKIGLFGRLKEEARVRARIEPRYPRSKGERRDRKKARAPKAEPAPAAPSAVSGEPPTTEEPAPTPARKRPKADQPPTRVEAGPRRRRRTGGPGATMDTNEEAGSFGDVTATSTEELAHSAEDFLRGLLGQLGTSASVSWTMAADDVVELEITGDDLGTLIGPKGATLLALQEITRIVVQRHSAPSDCRVVVDINGYRKRRQEALARFAQQVAAEVVSTNKKRALEPMPPADRKVVHDAVNEIEGVNTISEGEEPNRRVVLVPATGPDDASEPDLQSTSS